MERLEELEISFEGVDNLLKALHDGSLLKKLRNENRRLKREVKRLRKENAQINNLIRQKNRRT